MVPGSIIDGAPWSGTRAVLGITRRLDCDLVDGFDLSVVALARGSTGADSLTSWS